MVKKEIRKSTRIIFIPLSFSPHTLWFCITCMHTLLIHLGKIRKKTHPKREKPQFPVQSTSHLLAASHIWPRTLRRGYRLLSSGRRIPICRDYNSFSGRLTSPFKPLGKSLRFSTTYSILVYFIGLSHGQPQQVFNWTRSGPPAV